MALPVAGTLQEPATGKGADRLGLVLMLLATLSLAAGPFVSLKANRIAEGEPLMVWAALALAILASVLGTILGGIAVLAARPGPLTRLVAPSLGLAAVLAAIALAAGSLVPPADRLSRLSPDWGFWLGLVFLALAVTDGVARMHPSPRGRALAVFCVALAVVMVLRSGALDGLAVMREYAVRADVFGREFLRHLQLALGAAAAAIGLGLPLGLALHGGRRFRGPVLGVLTAIQAVPSIALFGLLMAPLAWLAHQFPWLGAVGIRGIGAAPAFIALTLYALLPIVAATVTGLACVPPEAVDAARGAGMTDGQILRSVELPLAFAAVLAGVRVVLVQTIGLTTVAALIGGGGLGTFVFQGLGQTAIDLVLLGALPVVAMAVAAGILLDAAAEAMRWPT